MQWQIKQEHEYHLKNYLKSIYYRIIINKNKSIKVFHKIKNHLVNIDFKRWTINHLLLFYYIEFFVHWFEKH